MNSSLSVLADYQELSVTDPNREALARWSAWVEPTDTLARQVVAQLGLAQATGKILYLAGLGDCADDALIRQTLSPVKLPDNLAKLRGWLLRCRQVDIRVELDYLVNLGGCLLIPGDLDWPVCLDALGDNAPLALWVRGNPRSLHASQLGGSAALVGARAASRYGTSLASEIAYDLVSRGVWVMSGGAYGIDAAAHFGALRGGGLTISVQAGGLGELYPRSNDSLFSQILESGCLISEVPCTYRPAKRYFLSRNRLIAALSQVVVVVEAGIRSGALNTANHAAEQGRLVAALPGSVTSPASVGCHNLIREGATLVTNAAEIIELMAPLGAQIDQGTSSKSCPESLFNGLSNQAMCTLDSLPVRAWATVEQIANSAGLGVEAALSELGLLEMDGRVESRQGKYRRIR